MFNQVMPTPADTSPTRTRILDAARRLFLEQGYHATGVATILREAGVNSGSLYHFFGSKEALLVGVLERYTELLQPVVLAPAEEATDDPIERVFALLDWYRRGMVETRYGLGCPIGNLALELGDSLPAARTLIDRNFEGWCAGVRRWLDDAGDRLPPDLDRAALARFILTVMEGSVMQSRARLSIEPFDDCIAQLRAHFEMLEQAAQAQTGD